MSAAAADAHFGSPKVCSGNDSVFFVWFRLLKSRTTREVELATPRPITFRLPKPGTVDPFFGISRSHYYVLEQRGVLQLIRIREVGRERGITLVPFDKVAAFVRAQAEAQDR